MMQNTHLPKTVINCASPQDDTELRRLLREIRMDGHMDVAFTREPGYFKAAQVEGENVDVVVARDTAAGKIVALGSRAEKDCYVNGQPDRIGYLSGLRCDKQYRRGTLVGRGYRFLKELHRCGGVKFYLTSIIEDNHIAKQALTSGKAGLPTYKDFGRFHTLSICPPETLVKNQPLDLKIQRAQDADTTRITEFLRHNGRRRQFFPVYQKTHFENKEGILRGLRPSDLYLAIRKGRLVGTLGLWDQKSFKQCVINNYSTGIKIIRPLVNLFARLSHRPELPRPGSTLHYLILALVSIENDDTEIFECLFRHALAQAANFENLHSVMAGFHEKDPFLQIARRIPHLEYLSRLYLVFWQDGQGVSSTLDDRIPYLELGAL